MNKVKTAFISYSRKDLKYLEEFKVHISGLTRKGLIEDWTDQEIIPGKEWESILKEKLHSSDIIFFLVSPDFIASDYINDIEIKMALERYYRGEVIIVPIIIRPCDFDSIELNKFQALPKDLKPISIWSNVDEAWLNVIEGIKKLIKSVKLNRTNHNQEYQNMNNTQNNSTLTDKGEIKHTITELTEKNKGIDTLFKDRPPLYLFEQVFEGDLQPQRIKNDAELYERFKTILIKEFIEESFENHKSNFHFDTLLYSKYFNIEIETTFDPTNDYHTYKVFRKEDYKDEIKIEIKPFNETYVYEAVKCNLYAEAFKFEKQRIIEKIDTESDKNQDDFRHFLFKLNRDLLRLHGKGTKNPKLVSIEIDGNRINNGIISFGKQILYKLINKIFNIYNQYLSKSHINNFKYILSEHERSWETSDDDDFEKLLNKLIGHGFSKNANSLANRDDYNKDGIREVLKVNEFFEIKDYEDKLKFWKEIKLEPSINLLYKEGKYSIIPNSPEETYSYNKFVIELCENNINDGSGEVIEKIDGVIRAQGIGYAKMPIIFDLEQVTFDELKEEFISSYNKARDKKYLVEDEIKKLELLKEKKYV